MMTFITHQTCRLVQTGWTTTDIFGAFAFALSDLPGAGNFTALWDEYRFRSVKLHFYPVLDDAIVGNTVVGVTTAAIQPPSLLLADDYTDNVTPTENILLEHEDLIFKGPMTQMHVHVLRPVPLVATYQGAFTGYGRQDNLWLETNSPGILHYGLKYAIHKGFNASGITCTFQIYATYELEFRKVVG
jgi:hypothetical protein